MKKLVLATLVAMGFGLAACGPNTGTPGTSSEGQSSAQPASTSGKTRADVMAELAAFQAACKADPKLAGCATGEALGTGAVVGSAKTKAEVSAELAAFLAACKANPAGADCPKKDGPN